MVTRRIFLILFILILITTIPCLFFDRAGNQLIVKNGETEMSYYIPDTVLKIEEDLSGKYFLLLGAYESFYSFDHLRFEHWWTGTFGLYFVLEGTDLSRSIVCFEEYSLEKTCYRPSSITADIHLNEIRNLKIHVGTDLGDVKLTVSSVDISDAISSTKLVNEYNELEVQE